MKKLFALLVLGFVSVAGVYAQAPFKYEMRFGIGGAPAGDILNVDYNTGMDSQYGDMYGDYTSKVVVSGILSAEFNFIFKKWFTLSLGMNTCLVTNHLHDSVSDEFEYTKSDYSLTVLPQARFTYLSKEYVKLYSSVGLGVSSYFNNTSPYIVPVFQTAPIGVMFGRKFFGFAELGLGTMYTGCMAGIGFRF